MTPKEYIRSLQEAKPRRSITPADLPEVVRSEIERTGKSIDEYVEEINRTDYAEYLLSLLKPRLPDQMFELFEEGFIAVGEVNDRNPNAYVKSVDREGYAIIFHTGLKDFIYRVARILSTRFTPAGTQDDSRWVVPNMAETARLIAEVFWWFQETSGAFGPQYAIEPNQVKIANLLSLEAEKFLLGHEIGHAFDMALDHNHPLFSKTSSTLPMKFREEHVADLFALSFSMELYNPNAKRDDFLTPLIYAGVEFAIQIYRALECLGFEFEGTHPSATQRLQYIRSHMKERCGSEDTWKGLTILSGGIDSMFEAILEILIDPKEHLVFFDQQAKDILSELDQLLESCTGGMVPDYGTFYSAAGKIFGRGYSHKMLERVAQVVFDFFSDVREHEKTKNSPNHEGWVHFQKFKLLLAFIDQFMTEPARAVFLQVFEAYKNRD